MPRRTVAVVTGDVNASRRMLEKDARRLEYMLKNCFQDVVATLNDVQAAGFTNFRGDAWQFVVGNPVMAVRATLLFRSLLLVHSDREFGRKIQTSASIGFGAIKFLPTETSSAGGGEAYENSGKRLDKLRRRVPGMGVAGLGETDLFLDSLLGVVDALARHWTALQALRRYLLPCRVLPRSRLPVCGIRPLLSRPCKNICQPPDGRPSTRPCAGRKQSFKDVF